MLGGQIGVAGHIQIGDNVKIGAQTGVMSNVKDNAVLVGTPSMDMKDYFRSYSVFKKLPTVYSQINNLQKEIEKLKSDNKL